MEASQEPEGEDGEDKPLLPKWVAWTWPTTWYWWALWGAGLLLLGWGLTDSLSRMGNGNSAGLGVGATGLFIMGWCSPNPFAQMMKKFTSDSSSGTWTTPPFPPMSPSDWHGKRKYWDEKHEDWLPDPLARYEHDGPRIDLHEDDEEWIVSYDNEESGRFSSEIEANDHMIELIKKGDRINAQELLFGDHPRHDRYRALYNASPPQFTSRFFMHALSVFFASGMFFGMPREFRESNVNISIAVLVLAAISTIVSHFWYRSSVEAWDTITSIIKFVDGGHGELVGQIRPMTNSPLKVLNVDGCTSPNWTFNDLVAWGWGYHATEEWKERVYNSQTKEWETRHRRQTRHIRGGHYNSDFLIHDGTGGLVVKSPTFERIDMGGLIWERSKRGGKGCGPYATPIHGGAMTEHRWTLSALRLAEPIYVMARLKSLPRDDVPRGTVAHNASRVHHTLQAVGEDAPRRHAKISKGNEFSVLSAKNSTVSRLGPFFLLIICAMAQIGL